MPCTPLAMQEHVSIYRTRICDVLRSCIDVQCSLEPEDRYEDLRASLVLACSVARPCEQMYRVATAYDLLARAMSQHDSTVGTQYSPSEPVEPASLLRGNLMFCLALSEIAGCDDEDLTQMFTHATSRISTEQIACSLSGAGDDAVRAATSRVRSSALCFWYACKSAHYRTR